MGLAVNLETGEDLRLTPHDLARHTYLIGATGAGKTTAILRLLEADIRGGHSVAVLDLRGDLVAGTLALCSGLAVAPERVTLLDLREKQQVRGFNPLAGAGEPFIRALHVLDVLAGEAPSWGVQLEETLRSALLLLAEAGEPLTKLEQLFADPTLRATCLRAIEDESLSAFWLRFDELSTEKQHVWQGACLNKVTSLLAVPTLRRVLSGENGIDLGSLLTQEGQVVLVSLAVDEYHRSSRMLGSLMVSAIAREVMARVNLEDADRVPLRLYIDEFENMASAAFDNLIAEGRRFYLSLCLSHQTLSQLPAKLRSVIRNNVGITFVFQVGHEDARELARDLPDGIEAKELRELPVGAAYMLRRDGTADLVRFHPSTVKASRKAVAEFRDAVLPKGSANPQSTDPGKATDGQTGNCPPEDWL